MNFNNPRERVLAIALGGVFTLVVLWMGYSRLSVSYTTRYTAIAGLEKKIKERKKVEREAVLAGTRMAAYRRISLPTNLEVARSEYQNWLLECVGNARLANPQVNVGPTRTLTNLCSEFTFIVGGRGDLQQAVGLLYDFYQPGYLHRISRISLKPVPESKQLDVSLTIHAIALEKADEKDQLPPIAGNRLSQPDLAAYQQSIVGRNLFGKPNTPPRLAGAGRKDATLQRELEVELRGTDADPLDKLSYALESSADPGARLDPKSGKFRWTPKSKGDYEFVVAVTDDGIPAKTAKEKLVIRVNDPPPPEKPAPPKLAFDHAKFAVLTGIVSASGESEAWLHVRPTGQMLKLHLGDKFEVGSVSGTVIDINPDGLVYESGSAQKQLLKGQTLDQSQPMSGS